MPGMTHPPSQDPWAETTPVTDFSRTPPDRRRFLIISAAAITVMVGIIVVVFALYGPRSPTAHLTGCSNDGILTTAKYTVTNNDRVAHDYYVEGTVGHSPTSLGILKNVAAGETASGTLTSTTAGDCRITKVDQR